jgi:intracellular multiplication protein IcmB
LIAPAAWELPGHDECFGRYPGSDLVAAKQPVESFIQLETADDNTTLVAADGSMVSFLRIHGSRQIIGDANIAGSSIRPHQNGFRFDRPGYAMQVYFMRDPSMVGSELSKAMQSNRNERKR